jgi:hypothetical protein
MKFEGRRYSEISDAFSDLYFGVSKEYEKWDEGEKVDWDKVASLCGTMLAVFGDDIKDKPKPELRTPDSSDYMELSDGERIKLMIRESEPYDSEDEFELIKLDSVWDYDSETDTGSDRAEAREFIKEVWDDYQIVATYQGDNTNYDNLMLHGRKSKLYEFLLESKWYGGDEGYNAEQVMELHPEITDGGWVI